MLSQIYAGGRLRRSALTAPGLGYGGALLAGFIVGAVFWHFVGFWNFVSKVVLEPGPLSEVTRAMPLGAVAGIDRSAPACVTLELDRVTGLTSLAECAADAAPLPHGVESGREDFALLPEAERR
jgi:hypothetical protein